MHEDEWAARFSRDVDALLPEIGAPRGAPAPAAPPPAYRPLLDLAQTLAATDWSAESNGRAALRARLLAECAGGPVRARPARTVRRGGRVAQSLVLIPLVLGVLICIGLLTMAVAHGGGAAGIGPTMTGTLAGSPTYLEAGTGTPRATAAVRTPIAVPLNQIAPAETAAGTGRAASGAPGGPVVSTYPAEARTALRAYPALFLTGTPPP